MRFELDKETGCFNLFGVEIMTFMTEVYGNLYWSTFFRFGCVT